MKKEIFTAFIMIILAVFFSSCDEWDIEIIDPRDFINSIESTFSPDTSEEESSESESKSEESASESENSGKENHEVYSAKSVLRDEAEEFFGTEEAFDDIKLFVSHLGNVSFERTREIVNPKVLLWFSEEIFEAAGKPGVSGGYFDVEKSFGNRFIKKYFGTDFVPAEGMEGFDAETDTYLLEVVPAAGKNRFLSCETEMLGGNRAKCTVLMVGAKDSIGENFVISEMVFDVMEDGEGKFLRIVSNKVVEKFREASFEDQAKTLTELIVEQMGKAGFENSVQVKNQQTVLDFAVRLQAKVNLHREFDKKSPYIGKFYRDDKGYHFPVSSLKKIASEVYGIENIDSITDPNFKYDRKEKEYTSGLGWGNGRGASAENMETYVSGNTYIVRFDLVTLESVDGNPEWVAKEKYKMTFELMEGSFLRFIGYDRA